MNSRYTYSGTQNKTINASIKPGSEVYVNGTGNLTINVPVPKGVTIYFNGTGQLRINERVEEDVQIYHSGTGDLKFTHTPPHNVINNISNTGTGSIFVGGKKIRSSHNTTNTPYTTVVGGRNTTFISGRNSSVISGNIVVNFDGSFSGNNMTTTACRNGVVEVTKNGVTTRYQGWKASTRDGQLFIDGIRVRPSDNRMIPNTNQPQPSSHSQINTSLSQANKQSQQNKFNSYTEAYVNRLKQKPKNTDILRGIELSPEEEALLEPYSDPIYGEVINIPVILNERLYDLDTLLRIQKGDKLDPYNKIPFSLYDIQAAREKAGQLEEIIKTIKNSHEIKNKEIQDTNSSKRELTTTTTTTQIQAPQNAARIMAQTGSPIASERRATRAVELPREENTCRIF